MDSWAQSQWDAVLDFFGNDDFNVNVWGTFLLSFVAYWSLGGFFTFIDITGKPKALLKYKVQDVKSYPVRLLHMRISLQTFNLLFMSLFSLLPIILIRFKWSE